MTQALHVTARNAFRTPLNLLESPSATLWNLRQFEVTNKHPVRVGLQHD